MSQARPPSRKVAATDPHELPAPGSPPEEAIPHLLDAFGPRLYTLAKRLCGNAEDARDMVQEVFLQAFRKWQTYTGAANPGTWLHAIAARSCKERARRKGGINRRVPPMSQLLPWRESRTPGILDPQDPGDQPVMRIMRSEAVRAVQQAIIDLPDHFRLPLILKEILGLPLEEVARALSIRPETAKTRLYRARMLIRKDMLRKTTAGHDAPPASYDRQICMDLLQAKLEAMDRGRGFPVGQEVVCQRCRAVFAELDIAQNACAELAQGQLPGRVRSSILRAMHGSAGGSSPARPPAKRHPLRAA